MSTNASTHARTQHTRVPARLPDDAATDTPLSALLLPAAPVSTSTSSRIHCLAIRPSTLFPPSWSLSVTVYDERLLVLGPRLAGCSRVLLIAFGHFLRKAACSWPFLALSWPLPCLAGCSRVLRRPRAPNDGVGDGARHEPVVPGVRVRRQCAVRQRQPARAQGHVPGGRRNGAEVWVGVWGVGWEGVAMRGWEGAALLLHGGACLDARLVE